MEDDESASLGGDSLDLSPEEEEEKVLSAGASPVIQNLKPSAAEKESTIIPPNDKLEQLQKFTVNFFNTTVHVYTICVQLAYCTAVFELYTCT